MRLFSLMVLSDLYTFSELGVSVQSGSVVASVRCFFLFVSMEEGFHFLIFKTKMHAERMSKKHRDEAYPRNNCYPETVTFYCKQCRGLLAMNVRLLEKIRSFYWLLVCKYDILIVTRLI